MSLSTSFGGVRLARMALLRQNQAPGTLEMVRAFLNTADLENPRADFLATIPGAGEWLGRTGLPSEPTEAARVRLVEFREALRGVVAAGGAGTDPSGAWPALEPFALRSSYRMNVTERALPALEPLGYGADAAIATLLAAVYTAIVGGTWARLKVCRKQSCRWAFYDLSKNGSGVWCSMAICGNRMKAKRRRARTRSIMA